MIHIPDAGIDGKLVIKNRADHNRLSGGNTLQFKQLDVLMVTYDQNTIDYEYDAVSRLLSAVYAGTSKRFEAYGGQRIVLRLTMDLISNGTRPAGRT